MANITKIEVIKGVYWVEVQGLRILCGCPSDIVKHLIKIGLLIQKEKNGVVFENGPNAILLSDVMLQSGAFSNMAEFPVLQMLYRQGLILPNHPNNNGEKPLLIGSEEQLHAQLEYIYRGNYGLISKEEIMEAGVEEEVAQLLMEVKLKFAFGKIRDSRDLLDSLVLEDKKVEIKNGIFIERRGLNIFEITYEDEKIEIDLNLKSNQKYTSPYSLGFYNLKREYFAIIHAGQGDGWDATRPCMSSILLFQGKIYLIDAGPNIEYILMALGIGISEVEGIFHTHSHDDHFAGITALLKSDKKIKYYATKLVRISVAKKLSALLSMPENIFNSFFEVMDLKVDEWNLIEGLEVKPIMSPHPVETNIFYFKTIWKDGYKLYGHLADIVSLKVLNKIVKSSSILDEDYFKQIQNGYLEHATIKKIDIGGGLIHGEAEGFISDVSEKIVLSHTSRELTNLEKGIGSGAHFGSYDILIHANQEYGWRYAYEFLLSYFLNVPHYELRILLNCPIEYFTPESILIREGKVNDYVFLVVAGTIEMIDSKKDSKHLLSAGALIGEMSGLIGIPSQETYRAVSYVQVLKLPSSLFLRFIKKNKLYADMERLRDKREFLSRTWLFGEEITYPTQNKIANAMKVLYFKSQDFIEISSENLFLVKRGTLKLINQDLELEKLEVGGFFGEEILFQEIHYKFKSENDSELYSIPGDILKDIPIVNWKLFETYRKRQKSYSPRPNQCLFQ